MSNSFINYLTFFTVCVCGKLFGTRKIVWQMLLTPIQASFPPIQQIWKLFFRLFLKCDDVTQFMMMWRNEMTPWRNNHGVMQTILSRVTRGNRLMQMKAWLCDAEKEVCADEKCSDGLIKYATVWRSSRSNDGRVIYKVMASRNLETVILVSQLRHTNMASHR